MIDNPIARSVLFLFYAILTSTSSASGNFNIVHTSQYSGLNVDNNEEYVVHVVQTQDEFNKLWLSHTSNTYTGSAKPDINFTKKTLVCVVYPYRTGGVYLHIASVIRERQSTSINLKMNYPKRGSMVTQVLTKNTIMLVIDKTKSAVQVNINK